MDAQPCGPFDRVHPEVPPDREGLDVGTNPEILLISSILRNGDLVTALKSGLLTEMFHLCREEFAWLEEFQTLYRKTPDKLSFKNKFPEFRIQRCDDTAHQTDEVRKSHIRHEMLDMMSDTADMLSEGDIEGAVRKATSKFIQIAASTGNQNDEDIFTGYADILGDVQARVARVAETGSAGVPFGIASIDEATGGASPGDLWIVGARLGVGKSWMLQTMACHAVMDGLTVQFDALEQSRAQVGMRMHSLMSGKFGKQIFASNALMQGKEFSLSAYMDFLKKLKNDVGGKMHVSDASRGQVSVATVAAQIERNKPDVVYIDYITLMKKASSEWQGVAQLSGDLKALATSYQVPIIGAAQLNREHGLGRKGEPPGTEALAQSDSIGQDADGVITAAKFSQSVIKGKLAKNRNGVGERCFYLQFQPSAGIIKEITANAAQRLVDRDREEQDKNGDVQ
jgi:replicative DNA helicase